MILITYILALFLILSVIAVTILFVQLMKENKNLHTKNDSLQKSLMEKTTQNTDLQSKLDALMK